MPKVDASFAKSGYFGGKGQPFQLLCFPTMYKFPKTPVKNFGCEKLSTKHPNTALHNFIVLCQQYKFFQASKSAPSYEYFEPDKRRRLRPFPICFFNRCELTIDEF